MRDDAEPFPTIDDVVAARSAIADATDVTPAIPATALGERLGRRTWLKAESLQRSGSFKIRGAANKIHSLGDVAERGVIAGSAGNHARALALAAQRAGIDCTLIVPAGAAITKVEACRALGAHVTEHPGDVDDAIDHARMRAAEGGITFCAPFDDPAVIAGQGTIGLEMLDQTPDVDLVLIPLGGGGLASGIALAMRSAVRPVTLIGVQAAACAPYADGRDAVRRPTLADGIAVKRPGRITGPLVRSLLDDIVTVSEDAIADAMTLLLEESRMVVEGAGAVGVAALLEHPLLAGRGRGDVSVVVSGGNVDLDVLQRLIRRRESTSGRRVVIDAVIDDRPGTLAALLAEFAGQGADLIDVYHLREGIDLGIGETAVRATYRVRNRVHADEALGSVRAAGYRVSDDLDP